MEYKLFDEYITLQSLLKITGVIPSGGAIKSFLAENIVLYNGEKENRRGKKIRIGDIIELPNQGQTIHIIAPSQKEIDQYRRDLVEKKRVTKMVKEMNKQFKKDKKKISSPAKTKKDRSSKKAPVRFPGI